MAFNEDQNRARKDHGSETLAMVRCVALGSSAKRANVVKLGAKKRSPCNCESLFQVLLSPGNDK